MKKRDSLFENLCKLYKLTEGKPFKSNQLEGFTSKIKGYKNSQSLTHSLINGGQNGGYLQPMQEGDVPKKSHRLYTWIKIPYQKIKNPEGKKVILPVNFEPQVEVLKNLFGQTESFLFKDILSKTEDFTAASWWRVLKKLLAAEILVKESDPNDKRVNIYFWSEKKSESKTEVDEDVILSPYKIEKFERIGSQDVIQVINNEDRVVEKLIGESGDFLDLFLSLMIKNDILSEVGKGQKGRIFILNRDKYLWMSIRQPLLNQLKSKREEILNRETELMSQIEQMKNGDMQNQRTELEKLEKEIAEFEDVLKNMKLKQRSLKQQCESLEKSISSRMKISLGIVKSDLDMVRKRLNLITSTTQCSNTELEGILKLL